MKKICDLQPNNNGGEKVLAIVELNEKERNLSLSICLPSYGSFSSTTTIYLGPEAMIALAKELMLVAAKAEEFYKENP